MGLDQTWFVRDEQTGEETELHYHRKVPALQDWMQRQWLAQNPASGFDDFNCENLEVTSDMLAELKADVLERNLNEQASGFFWGSHYDEDYADILTAIDKAETSIHDQLTVYYTSWW